MIYQAPLPDLYQTLSDEQLTSRIQAVRARWGSRLVILAHHYQRPEIVALSDVRGDSLQLAQFAATQGKDSQYIVFCGVHFMAETADMLKTGDQQVILPDLGAGCDLADAADADDVIRAWDHVVRAVGHEDILPITYINSTAALKAFVGQKGGIVCTSSNAETIIQWALDTHRLLFFYPDQHLGRNTCVKLGIPLSQTAVWNPHKADGGLSQDVLKSARVLLWEGCCPVHQMFTATQISKIRQKDPEFRIIAHPECSLDVVSQSDAVGSTDFIVRSIANSPAGSKWAVGTELNLVSRIASENPDKTVISINPFLCLCGTMNRIDKKHLAWALDSIDQGTPHNVIRVGEPDRTFAKQALLRMLEMSKRPVSTN